MRLDQHLDTFSAAMSLMGGDRPVALYSRPVPSEYAENRIHNTSLAIDALAADAATAIRAAAKVGIGITNINVAAHPDDLAAMAGHLHGERFRTGAFAVRRVPGGDIWWTLPGGAARAAAPKATAAATPYTHERWIGDVLVTMALHPRTFRAVLVHARDIGGGRGQSVVIHDAGYGFDPAMFRPDTMVPSIAAAAAGYLLADMGDGPAEAIDRISVALRLVREHGDRFVVRHAQDQEAGEMLADPVHFGPRRGTVAPPTVPADPEGGARLARLPKRDATRWIGEAAIGLVDRGEGVWRTDFSLPGGNVVRINPVYQPFPVGLRPERGDRFDAVAAQAA
ncbi:MAG: hypothetical protein Q8S13_10035, partial [Dehalococcoidia bacterium]|nr:hypothetical protein [Dehalococcoidia bacterium]